MKTIKEKQHRHFNCLVLIATLLLLSSSGMAQDYNATINCNLKQMKPGTKVIYQWYDKEHLTEGFEGFFNVLNTEKGFTIKLNVPEGGGNELVMMIGKGGPYKILFLYLDKGIINVSSPDSVFSHLSITGSSFATDLDQFHRLIDSDTTIARLSTLKSKATRERLGADSLSAKAFTALSGKLDSVRKTVALQWINSHLNSPVSPFIIHNVYEPLFGKLTIDEQEALLNRMGPSALDNKVAAGIRYTIRTERITGIGKMAPQFTQPDTSGRPVSLKDFKGKYVLLDFWASWCGPCRRENPNVVKAFDKYKDKGFTILSVSLDRASAKDAWLKAIHDDHLGQWTHVSDLKYWGNEAVKSYDINSVPANFLIDPNGKIIAKDLHGFELERKLAQLIK